MKHLIIFLINLLSCSGVIYAQQWSTNSNGIHYDGGNVGIGYNNPQYKLHISGASSSNVIAEFNKNGSGAQNSIIRIASNSTVGLTLGHQDHFREAYIDHNYSGATTMLFRLRGSNKMSILNNGNVGIGILNPDSKLTVNGKIKAEEIQVVVDVPADYVFDDDYKLKALSEVEQYVNTHKHLPEIPSAEEIKEQGWEVGKMQNLLLQKIEELTLYVIEQNKQLAAQNEEISRLKISNEILQQAILNNIKLDISPDTQKQ